VYVLKIKEDGKTGFVKFTVK